jgi:hypothetical protein
MVVGEPTLMGGGTADSSDEDERLITRLENMRQYDMHISLSLSLFYLCFPGHTLGVVSIGQITWHLF